MLRYTLVGLFLPKLCISFKPSFSVPPFLPSPCINHMAEVLGVAASGIAVAQVAAQVGKSIIKLKQLWDDLQDVPSSIADLFDQIDCLDPALWEAEHSFNQANLPPLFWDDTIANRSTVYCRKALGSLTELINELSIQINRTGKFKSKILAVKVVLKKEQLKRLENRLQNAIRMLTLAQQSYLVALTRMQPDIIIQRFTEIVTPLALQNGHHSGRDGRSNTFHQQTCSQRIISADNEENEHHDLVPRKSLRRQDTMSIVRLRLPMWLYGATWELQCARSYGNWKFNVKYYHIRPWDSGVFEFAQNRSPKDLQELFSRGLASPYDRDDEFGNTLLHYAVEGQNMSMVKYLLEVGVSPSEGNDRDYKPLSWLLWSAVPYEEEASFITDFSSIDGFDEFCDFGNAWKHACFDNEAVECICRYGLKSRGVYKLLRPFECPWHETTTLESRLINLRDHLVNIQHPMVTADLFQPYWSQDLRALCATSMNNFSLIHTIAMGLGIANARRSSRTAHYDCPAGWVHLADMVIGHTPNVHHVENHNPIWWYTSAQRPRTQSWLTPLMAMIATCTNEISGCGLRPVSGLLRAWLSKVQSNGHDLKEYGRRENEMLHDKDLNLDRVCYIYRHASETSDLYDFAYLWGYEYGPKPEDWKVLWGFPERSYAADFWRLIEDGPQLVPGAWVDDSDDSEVDYSREKPSCLSFCDIEAFQTCQELL
ncbi:hypothetical protein HD806DRAFT_508224 [Xylariaceae sp. AK1471]|nr:hypothetical protein HD806DRAFT_508224 [Xylariaceae sp. AK1471]